ncbi:MAG: C25 family cysteine peptidase, partial [Ignavibacteria bacterium]|nr:C25 family cysteine peptidase [Ignavibacteria bacterium]
IRKNLVPSYGNPVSDAWYVMWDSLNVNIPQMFVGRIPARNNDEVLFYLQKHQTYINRQFDSWNKNYLFFSGGDINDPIELAQIKGANDDLLTELVRPKPVGGSGIHFYKTVNPPTNFGPFSLAEVNDAIDNGGLFISYIGHSGTQTWDNGIRSTEDLKNSYPDRNPLITDFGCSTGKFAEPDIDAFGELFLLENPNGQAINYLGNTSWGYLSTSLRFPDLFYSKLLISAKDGSASGGDTASSVGEAHLLAKMQQFNESGFTDVNKVFNYCNLLFGDPIIRFKTPLKPNFSLNESSFAIVGENPNDMTDSVTVKIEILNTGRVPEDSLTISVTSKWFDEIIYQSGLKIPAPFFRDTLTVNIPIDGRIGQHKIEVGLDTLNSIEEIYETDNSALYTFTVYSTSVRPIEVEKFYTASRDSVRVLNPVVLNNTANEIKLSISDNRDFINPSDILKSMDSVYTTIKLNSLTNNERYWWRVKLNDENQEWSEAYSFKNISPGYEWLIDESFNENNLEYYNSAFDSSAMSWKLTTNENLLEISSAGASAGAYASFIYNGQEYLANTYFWGIGTAEIDTITLEPKNFRFFVIEDPNPADSMITYLNSLPEGTVLAMAICDDGVQSVLGFSGGTPVRMAIENYGSLYIDSVRYRDSWCIIGKKGAPQGSVPESFKKDGSGPAEISASNVVNNDSGYIVFPAAEKSYEWINIEKNDSLPPGSSIEYLPLGIKVNGDIDTLDALNFSNNISSLNNIDASIYSSLKIFAKLNANEFFESPSITSLGINYKVPPELAINYQVVNVSSDSLLIGEDVKLNFGVYNASETPADSFKVLVEVLKSNNEREVVSNILVDKLDSLSKKFFEVQLNTSDYLGNNNFIITVDSENKVTEIFEDNNFYQIPFYVKPDTSTASINITFDGVDILDGDYISANPEIKIELFDPSLLPVNDTSSITLFLNEEEIYFANNPQISYQFSSSNPKMIVIYKPQLSTGEYSLRVIAKNAAGIVVDSSGIEKYFIVNEETEILNVYNYPNPSSGETYFTFKLTQIPDELKIKIYTVAGRLIKEIKKTSSELDYDFNTIFWDGKDDDKNQVANGVYFYKVLVSKDGKNQDVTQKLAIVR